MPTIDARTRFKASVHAKQWNDLTATEMYAAAVSAALLSMVASPQTDSAAANFYRLEGARHFLGILTNLTSALPVTSPVQQNLETNKA